MLKFTVSRKTVGAMMLAGGLMYLISPIGTNSVPAPGGQGNPNPPSQKWHPGDDLRSHNYAGGAWVVYGISQDYSQYQVLFSSAGSASVIWVDRANLESPDIYKVN